jgi:hypothetical protein
MAQSPGKTPAAKKSAPIPQLIDKPVKAAAPKKASAAKAASAKEPSKPAVRAPAKKAAPAKGNGEAVSRRTPAKAAPAIGGVTPEQRYRMICDAAYFRAERRGFVGGSAVQDWLDAESEIDDLLRSMQP